MKQNDRSRLTRAALLRSGCALFSSKGFDGAAIREIAAHAGASLGAVTYHFGTKESLYAAVGESTLAPMVETLVDAATSTGAPLDRVERVVRRHFEYLVAHPELPRLMLRSLLDTGQPPAGASRQMRQLLTALVALVRAGQQDATIRAGLPLVMAIGIMSPSLHLTVMRGVLPEVGGLDLDSVADRSAILDLLVAAVRGGLAAPTGDTP